MDSYSDFNAQQDVGFTEMPFAEVPFEDVPFDETVPAEAIPVPADVSTVIQTVAPVAPVQEPSASHPVTTVVQNTASTTSSSAQPDAKDTSDEDEEKKRAEHEAKEAERKAAFEARQAAKKKAYDEQLEKANNMSDEEVVEAAVVRAGEDTEKITRKNMKDCVAEHIQTLCLSDPAFARLTMHPRKKMVHCFQYITRKAWEYIQDELKADGIQPGQGAAGYGAAVPEGLCYQWAEDYFRDPTAKEDEEEEETFTPKPYPGKPAPKTKAKKPAEKKKTEKKPPEKKAEEKKPANDDQLSFGQMALI